MALDIRKLETFASDHGLEWEWRTRCRDGRRWEAVIKLTKDGRAVAWYAADCISNEQQVFDAALQHCIDHITKPPVHDDIVTFFPKTT